MSLTEMEKKFLKMTEGKGYKKISLNLREETINKIDEFAKILNISRTLVIESILLYGFKPYVELLERGKNQLLKRKNVKNKGKIGELGKKLQGFKRKYFS